MTNIPNPYLKKSCITLDKSTIALLKKLKKDEYDTYENVIIRLLKKCEKYEKERKKE